MKKFFFTLFLLISASNFLSRPYVVLISFDGFRWDYSERDLTPNLDSLKLKGVHAHSLRPSFPTKTFPNHYSIITGMYPENHGIIFNGFLNTNNGKNYRLGDTLSVRESEWYLGEAFWETAERNGIKTASYFWPGSEIKDGSRRPTYYKKYNHNLPYKERIDGVIEWLELPKDERPNFITLYFHDTDSYGHEFGPNSPEINESIKRLDSLINYLNYGLREIGLFDSTNIIIVSDHGMTEINSEKVINIEQLLKDFDVMIGGSKPVMMIKPNKNEIQKVYDILKNNEFHFQAYLKKNMPGYYHFNKHPFIYPIVLVADIGWSLVTDEWLEEMKKYGTKGNHGYDNNHSDMHGIFLASGPVFKENYKIGTVNNIDIYPLLCRIFDIVPRSNIDGSLNNIEFILK